MKHISRTLPLIALAGLAPAAFADSTPPVLASVLVPPALPVLDAGVNHFPVLEVEASDIGGSGVQFLEFVFAPIEGTGEFLGENEIITRVLADRNLADGNLQNGRFAVEARVPRGTPPGDYRLRAIKLADAAGNIRDYAADGSAPAIPMAAPFGFTVSGTGPATLPTIGDSAAPGLASARIQPTSLGVASSAGFFNLDLDVTDDVSGVADANVWVVSPSGIFMNLTASGHEAVTAGNEKVGTLHLRGRLPEGSEAGLWRVAIISLVDRTGRASTIGWESGGTLDAAMLLVYTTDEDGDGHLADDMFPQDSTEWNDHDRDGIGDTKDLDDDNDGLPDTWESQHGLDPLSPDDANFDGDHDGLTNLVEFLYGTLPVQADSDGDGLPDGQEGPVYGTNPKDHDSDGDGYLDGTEVSLGKSATAYGEHPAFKASGQREAGGFGLDFISRLGSEYRIEYTTDFKKWYVLVENVRGDGRPLGYLLPMANPKAGFYRVAEKVAAP